jgi:hypothetical protein
LDKFRYALIPPQVAVPFSDVLTTYSENLRRPLKNAGNYNTLSDPTSGFRIGSDWKTVRTLPWLEAPNQPEKKTNLSRPNIL